MKAVLDNGSWYHDQDVPILELEGLTVRILMPTPKDSLIENVADNSVLERMHYKFTPSPNLPKAPFTYGQRLYNHSGIDQIHWLINRVKRKPETKSASIGLLIAGEDAKHIPCLTTIDIKLRNHKLNLNFLFRSQNIFGRQYANLSALAALQQYMANELSVYPGMMSGFICSGHIYNFDVFAAKQLVTGEISKIKDRYYEKGPTD